MSDPTPRALPGRPEATSHAEIEQAAFRLFAERGFEGTTLDAIAAEVGVGRRTLFRYYSSKNDIPWGQFDRTLQAFRDIFRAMPQDLPLCEAIHRGVLAFNEFPDDAEPSHIQRMQLILRTPALQAHSALRYAEWRSVIAEYVAGRAQARVDDLVPQLVAQVALALALTAYDQWVRVPGSDLRSQLARSMSALHDYLSDRSPIQQKTLCD